MVEIHSWMETFMQRLDEVFGDRVWFVGLQGSYAREEATEHSDIDVVVILDELSPTDIKAYGAMLDTLPNRELICGFVSCKGDLLRWEPSDLFQLYHDTRPIKGNWEELLAVLDEDAVRRAIRIGACNIYHICVHNLLHGKKDKTVAGLYKTASFAVQAIVYLQTGRYISHLGALAEAAAPEERAIIETFMALKRGGDVKLEEMSERLFNWSKKWIG